MKNLILVIIAFVIVCANTPLGNATEIQNIIFKRSDNTIWKSTDAGKTWLSVKSTEALIKESNDELSNLGLKQQWVQELNDGASSNRIIPQNKNVYVIVPFRDSIRYSVYCISLNGEIRWRTFMSRDTSTQITSVYEGENDVSLSGFIAYTPKSAFIDNLYIRTIDTLGNVTKITNYRENDKCLFLRNGNLDWMLRLKDDNFAVFVPISREDYLLPTFTKVSILQEIKAYKEYSPEGSADLKYSTIVRVIESPSGDIYIFGQLSETLFAKKYLIYQLDNNGELLNKIEWDEPLYGLSHNNMTLLSNGNIAVVTSALTKPDLYYPTTTVSLFTSDLKLINTFSVTGNKYFQAYHIAELNDSKLLLVGATAPEYNAISWTSDPIWDYAVVTTDYEGNNQKLASWGDDYSLDEVVSSVMRGKDGTIYIGWLNNGKYVLQALTESPSGITESENNLEIFSAPNPSDGQFSVQANTGSTVRVFNLLGAMLESGDFEAGIWRSSPELYNTGQYIVEIEDSSGIKTYQKIIVVK